MKEENFLKLRVVTVIVTVILFIGVICLSAVNTDHYLVSPLFLASYLLSILSMIFAKRFLMMILFLAMAILLPVLEFFFIGSENFDANGTLLSPEKHGIFTHLGNLGFAFFSYVVPGIFFIAKLIHYSSHSMRDIGDKH